MSTPRTSARLSRRTALALPAGLIATGALGTLAAPASASRTDPSLSPTPYQGWNTFYGLGTEFTEEDVLAAARILADRGLQEAGYDIVWLDGGWQSEPLRDEDGDLRVDPERFPSGMRHLTDALHEMGLRAGIYTDAGTWNDQCGIGSGGHQQRDADLFAAWGFDAIKVDFVCGWAAEEDVRAMMTSMIEAIRANSSGRDMVVNLCNPVTSPYWGEYPEEEQSIGSWAYAPDIAESWRTYTDVGLIGQIRFPDVLRNFDANARHPEAAGPGHWNDPDYLGPELGMSTTQFRTQMTLWAASAAPLVIASDVATLSDESIGILTHEGVLAVNQDPLGHQARRVGDTGDQEVWAKELADGSRAVVLLNRSADPAVVAVTGAELGLGPRLAVHDVWEGRSAQAHQVVRESVPGHGAALLRIEKATGSPLDARLSTSTPLVTHIDGEAIPSTADALVAAGSTARIEVEVRHDGTGSLAGVDAVLTVPDSWDAADPVELPRLTKGDAIPVDLEVTVPTGLEPGPVPLQLELRRDGSVLAAAAVQVTVAPAPPAPGDDLAHHPWVSATSGWREAEVDRAVDGTSPLRIDGVEYATGIGVAAVSEIRYLLDGDIQRLTGLAGIDDSALWTPDGATVDFSIHGDGEELWSSGAVGRGRTVELDVDVSAVRDLRLVVGDGGDGTHNDRANWVELQLM